jgi:DNA-binding winged helix-turn-helix (wHTH) protein/TolB-like protein
MRYDETGRPARAVLPIRFGIFEFHPASGELRRAGAEVRLQAQPAQVLGILLAARGELVSRETLREAIWGNDTHVNFDRGLNFCVAQIRSALGDSGDSPRFIRTVPKRGYQFIAPVIQPEAQPETKAAPFVATLPQSHSRRGWVVAFAAGAASLAGAVWAKRLISPAPAPLETVAVTRFDNETGNVELDRFADGLTDSLVGELTSALAGHFGVIGNAAILRRARRDRDLIEIGKTLGSRYVVLGQVQQSGEKIRILAHLISLPRQTHVRVARIEENVTDPVASETRLARQISDTLAPRISSHPLANRS